MNDKTDKNKIKDVVIKPQSSFNTTYLQEKKTFPTTPLAPSKPSSTTPKTNLSSKK